MNKEKESGWYGQTVQTDTTPETAMVDAGQGKPYVLRTFEFAFNPEAIKKYKRYGTPLPTKQELFNMHWRQIQHMLWGDGLVARQDVEPRMIVGKKKYRIFLLCEPRLGVMVADKPQTLQDVFKKNPQK